MAPRGGLRDSDALPNHQIPAIRDLEDFSRLWICGVPALGTGYTIKLQLKGGYGPTIRLYRAAATDGSGAYLNVDAASNAQLTQPYRTAIGIVQPGLPSSPLVLDKNLFNGGANKYFLIEGLNAGIGTLELRIEKNGLPVASFEMGLEIRDVRDLYDQVAVVNVIDIPTRIENGAVDRSTFVPIASSRDAKELEDKQVLSLVHGWNMPYDDYRIFSATMFKRLFWSGFNGRFVSMRWPTPSKDDFFVLGSVQSLLTFNTSEYRAYRSGYGAAEALNYYRNRFDSAATFGLVTHSQGAVLTVEALRVCAAAGVSPVDNVIFMEGAMSAASFDATIANYGPLTDTSLRAASAAYQGYASSINMAIRRKAYNYYNPLDYALITGPTLPLGIPTTGPWLANQRLVKPMGGGWALPGMPIYYYGLAGAQEIGLGVTPRAVTDLREECAFVARSRSLPIGAVSSVGGLFTPGANRNLNQAQFGLDGSKNQHSGIFNLNFSRSKSIYTVLLQDAFAP